MNAKEMIERMLSGDAIDICMVIEEFVSDIKFFYNKNHSSFYWREELIKLSIASACAIECTSEYCYQIAFLKCINKWRKRYFKALVEEGFRGEELRRLLLETFPEGDTFKSFAKMVYNF